MLTWSRGRKRLTKAEKEAAENWNKERIKLINFLSRKSEIKKVCCICNKPGNILHNKNNPFLISFICKECRKDPIKLKKAKSLRFDVREKIDLKHLSFSYYSDNQVIQFINNFKNSVLTIGEYCQEKNVSRYQFNQIMKRYDELYPEYNIKKIIRNKFMTTQSRRAKQRAEENKIINSLTNL